MFRVLIADDEQYIRNGIADHINWGDIGCEVVGLAADGEEAMAIVEAMKPHVIITDIMMPIMTGLELVEQVRKKYPDMYIVIISGYDEFNYVQQALKLGAVDYILKPVDLEYIKEYISKLRDEYHQKMMKEEEHSTLINKVNDSLPVLKRQIMKDIMYERMSAQDGGMLLGSYEDYEADHYNAVLFAQVDGYSIKESDSSRRENYNEFLAILADGIDQRPALMLLDKREGELIICVSGGDRSVLNTRLKEACGLLQKEADSCMDKTLTIAIGSKSVGLEGLPESYKKAVELLEYKYVLGKNKIIDESAVKRMKQDNTLNLMSDFDEKELVASIKFSDETMIKEGLTVLEEKIREKGKDSYIYTNLIVGSIYRQALQELEETGGKIEDVFAEPLDVYTSIIGQETINGMIEKLHNALLSITKHISGLLLGKSAQIEKAKDYIQLNYADSEISLESVAKYVNMSISYFSNVFKQETGKTFVDFLTVIRIERAKEYLKKEYKSYEVSDMVGYNNPTYFSTVFKRVTGVTPSKYT